MKNKNTTIDINANIEKSDIRKYVEELYEEIKEVEEDLDNLSKEIEKINQIISSSKSREYIFFYKYYDKQDIIFAESFKDAIYELYKNENNEINLGKNLNNTFKKALRGLDDDDIDEIILLHNRLSNYKIAKVYLINKQIYDCEEE